MYMTIVALVIPIYSSLALTTMQPQPPVELNQMKMLPLKHDSSKNSLG